VWWSARERGSDGRCGEEISAGLIFLCFVSFYQFFPEHLSESGPALFYSGPALKRSNSGEKEMKPLKGALPDKIKISTFR
jgi:hypothetical protein